ncbi:pyroglutamyl-peptidase I [Cellulomonas sp. P22]|uniref:pyroglutamyl-peptidase I n=1 Tax=Cellulomonas sp. P22 TaxID=3373189 RepID=UPI0037940458
MSTILLTGFEPFDGQPVNASWEAVQHVEAVWDGDARLVTRLLPVSFGSVPALLRAAVDEVRPDVVVCVGEAGGRGRVGIERFALNLVDARIPDSDGAQPVDVPVVAGGPLALESTLPVKACFAAVRELGLPVEVSTTAGTYVCNATSYVLAHLLASTTGMRGGFVHVPRTPAQVEVGEPALSTADSARALGRILTVTLGTRVDARVAAGSEA